MKSILPVFIWLLFWSVCITAQSANNDTPSYAKGASIEAQEQTGKILSMLSIWNALSISFYGKVVDANGHPIVGAKVEITTSENNHFQKASDENGLFKISGIHGPNIIVSVNKEGYYNTLENSKTFGFIQGGSNYAPHAEPINPAIFVLRKIGPTEPLVSHSFQQLEIAKNGTPLSIDVLTGKKVGGENSFQIAIWTHDENDKPNIYSQYDWKCQISVPGGGIIQRVGDPYNVQAPSNGYMTEAVIDMPSTATNWTTRVDKDYYIKLSDGKYARANIEFYIGGFQFVNMTTYLNPSGSRNLEFNPEQRVKAP